MIRNTPLTTCWKYELSVPTWLMTLLMTLSSRTPARVPGDRPRPTGEERPADDDRGDRLQLEPHPDRRLA